MPGPVADAPSLSVVIPTLDGAGRLAACHDALRSALADWPEGRWEVLFVDDGSTDGTWPLLQAMAERDPRVTALRLGENVGQVGAVLAGLSRARGDVLVMMDDDLDTDPIGVPDLVAAIERGAEFASAVRIGERSPVRSLGSRLFNRRLRRLGFPFVDAGCGCNAMTREVAAAVVEAGWEVRSHRLKPWVAQAGFRVANVPVPSLRTSESHYGLLDLAASGLDIEVTFGPWRRELVLGAGAGIPALAATVAVARRRPLGALLAAGVAATVLAVDARRNRVLAGTRGRAPFTIVEAVPAKMAA